MEDPMAAYANKNSIIKLEEEEEEESGWTAYLEDFSCSNGGRSFISSSPSLVSDAAWNGVHSISHVRRLNFKNLKRVPSRNYSCNDDDLEDTASSPANSPKVSNNSKQMEVNYRRIDHHDDHIAAAAGNLLLGKRGCSSNLSEVGADEKNVKVEKMDEYVDLRKRGLCLVPMATLINFLG